MKKSILILSSFLAFSLLTGCGQTTPCPEPEQCPACEQCETCKECEECEECPVPHEHTFSEIWDKDETNHWHNATCEHTDLIKDLEAHIYGDDNVCDDCGYTKPAPVHVHTYDVEHWNNNATHHWHESTCEHKGLASDLNEHKFNSDGECSVCGYIKEKEHFNFVFKSDYCDLDNESIYEEGIEVELNLTLKEDYKSSLSLPSDVEIHSNEVLLVKGTDYSYEIEGDVAKLHLTINGNINIQVFRNSDESAFQVNEEEFNHATNASNFDYLQYDMYFVRYSYSALIMTEILVEYCPTIAYKGSAQLTTFSYHGDLHYDYSYIEKVDSEYTEYKYSNPDEGWVKKDSSETDFNDNKYVNLTMFAILGSRFELTYNAIKDHYNSVSNAYELDLAIDNYNVKFSVSFYDGKIINIAYSDDSESGFYSNADLSYVKKDVVIPEDAKPHVHTFATEWTKDETHHWHAATCEHKDEKDSYGEHTFDKDGTCTVCGYERIKLYPVITKITNTNLMDGTPDITTNVWADDFSNVVSTYGKVNITHQYSLFNEDGYETETGFIEDEVYKSRVKYTYDGDLKTSEQFFSAGVLESKRIYTFDEVSKEPTSVKYYLVNDGVETLYEETTYEYKEKSRLQIVKQYEDGAVTSYKEYEYCISKTDGSTKEMLYTRTDQPDSEKYIGYVIYNALGQVIESEDSFYISDSRYFGKEYITYTEDGNLSSITKEHDDGFRQKIVYTYNDSGYIVKKELFDYNTSTKEYDILTDGIDYTVDSYGTVIKTSSFSIDNGIKEVQLEREYEVKYVTMNFKAEYEYYLAETAGCYNVNEIKILPILG